MSNTAMTIIATNAALQSQVASAQAAKAAKCAVFMPNYRHDPATMRQYAECVQLVAPDSGEQLTTGEQKLLVGLFLACVIVGAVVGVRRRQRWEGALETAFFGGMIGAAVGLAVGLLAVLVAFLVSA